MQPVWWESKRSLINHDVRSQTIPLCMFQNCQSTLVLILRFMRFLKGLMTTKVIETKPYLLLFLLNWQIKIKWSERLACSLAGRAGQATPPSEGSILALSTSSCFSSFSLLFFSPQNIYVTSYFFSRHVICQKLKEWCFTTIGQSSDKN